MLLTLDGVEWSGTVSGVRRYRDDVRIEVGRGYETRPCAVELKEEESYEHIRVTCYPGPVPEPQFDPIDVSLAKSGD